MKIFVVYFWQIYFEYEGSSEDRLLNNTVQTSTQVASLGMRQDDLVNLKQPQ
jgi:hypothetical protein